MPQPPPLSPARREACPTCAQLRSPDVRVASFPMPPPVEGDTTPPLTLPQLTIWTPLASELDPDLEGYATSPTRYSHGSSASVAVAARWDNLFICLRARRF